MKTLKSLLSIFILPLLLTACESMEAVTRVGTAVGVASGTIDTRQAEAITQSASAVQKSFQDLTPEQEYYIGRTVGAEILSRYSPYPEDKANSYLNLVGQSLALESERPETFGGYHFLILDSGEINAFAAPGGLIFVTRGMLRCAPSEDTVAAVLAHEITHVAKKHGLQSIKQSRVTSALTSAALTAAQTAGPEELAKLTAVFEDSITDITTTLITSGYSRAAEHEADAGAVAILEKAGYDPRALIEMLKVMKTRLKPGGLDFAKTHPDPQDRIQDVDKEIGGFTPKSKPPAERRNRYQAALGGI